MRERWVERVANELIEASIKKGAAFKEERGYI